VILNFDLFFTVTEHFMFLQFSRVTRVVHANLGSVIQAVLLPNLE